MPTFFLDDREIPFEPGDTIIRAAWRQGMEIPHYCWHPGLSIAANCRMCLVEIVSQRPMMMPILKWDAAKQDYVHDTKPKLQPACQIAVTEGMKISSQSAHVKEAQQSVQEFLLLNHPVDCPICDQAGECKLQDYWLEHQHELKRKETEPVHKPKGVRFGPTIVYDAERCIMCTRCIRVCDEVAKDHVLDMRQRGNKNEIVLAPGRELDHDYTLMTEHVCPVGALTSRDFRFKARVWFLKSASGVCTGCATGCNTHVDFDPRYQKVYRLRPRDNMAVNKFWMCDDGMMTYKSAHERRILGAGIGRALNREEIPRSAALQLAADRLKKAGKNVAVVFSAHASTEDNFALARLARDVLGTEKLYLAAKGPWRGDDILRSEDATPNRAGALQAAGGPLAPLTALLEAALKAEVDAVIALGPTCAETTSELAALGRVATVVTLTANEGPLADAANIVIPVTHAYETSGTFTNGKGMAQSFERAIAPQAGIESAWETLVSLGRALGGTLGYAKLGELRSAMVTKLGATALEAR